MLPHSVATHTYTQRSVRMAHLPLLTDAEEAIDYYKSQPHFSSGPITAHVIRILVQDGYKNRDIREALGIEKVYTVTHFIRVSQALTDGEMDLWFNNPDRITLGHLRAIAKLDFPTREKLLRKLLVARSPVHEFESIARGDTQEKDVDIARFASTMSEVTGRPTDIRFNKKRKNGTITLNFYDLDDLDDLCRKLGFNPSEYF